MEDILLQAKAVKKYFNTHKGILHAVDGVTFDIKRGSVLGVVGESGCGKSTLGRVVVSLLQATDGEIIFEGKNIERADSKEKFNLRKVMQMIFQDPYASLDPRLSVSEIIMEPLIIYKMFHTKEEYNNRVQELMDTVGLAKRLANCYPHELDGGRRQRIGIARALTLNPKFIVCDEPVSALDVSIQAQILNLMQDLQEQYNLTYMFITHDMSVVKHISNEILVMYLGQMVEKCGADELFDNNLHPYTKALLSAIPIPEVGANNARILLKGEVTSPINPKPGCRFAPRCTYATEKCRMEDPQLEEVFTDHYVACHNVHSINKI